MNKSCNVLILGGGGFIGQNLCSWLKKAGYHVTAFDLVMPAEPVAGVDYVTGNFFDDETLAHIVHNQQVIIHSLSTLNPGNSNRCFLRGYSGDFVQTIKLFEMACRMGIRVIYLSSAGTVYGRYDNQPFEERHALQPINHYGSLKVCVETAMRSFNEQQGGHLISCRITNPYGPGQDFHKGVGFINAVLRHSLEHSTVEIWGDGEVIRDYIYIDDVCRMIERLISYTGAYHVFNIGTGVGTTQNEIVEIFNELGMNPKVQYLPSRAVDTRVNLINNRRISELMDDQFLTVREGIERYLHALHILIER